MFWSLMPLWPRMAADAGDIFGRMKTVYMSLVCSYWALWTGCPLCGSLSNSLGTEMHWLKVLDWYVPQTGYYFCKILLKTLPGFRVLALLVPGKKHHCYCRCWRLWDESDIRYSSIFRILVAAWVWISFGWSRLWNPSQKRRQTKRCRPMTTLGPVELFCCQSIWSVAVPCHFTLSPEKMQDPTMLAEAMPRHHCLKLPSFRLPAAYGDHGLIWAKEQKHHTTNTTA